MESLLPAAGEIPSNAFPRLLMKLLNEAVATDALWWLPGGKAFGINPKTVPSKILDRYLRGTKFSSFIRRLHNTGFRRTTRTHRKDPDISLPDGAITLSHDMFQRDAPELLENFSSTAVQDERKLSQLQEARARAKNATRPPEESTEQESGRSAGSLLSQAPSQGLDSALLQQQVFLQPSNQRLLESTLPTSSHFALREQDRLSESAQQAAAQTSSSLLGLSLPDRATPQHYPLLQGTLLQRHLNQENTTLGQQLLLNSLSAGAPQQQLQQHPQQQQLLHHQQQQLQRLQLELTAAAEQATHRQHMQDFLLLARARSNTPSLGPQSGAPNGSNSSSGNPSPYSLLD